MDPTNPNTCPSILSIPGSSNASLKEERCCTNIYTLAFEEYTDESRSIPAYIKEDISCTGVCAIDSGESYHVHSERPLSGIKLEHLHNKDDITEIALSKVSDIDKIYRNKATNLDVSTSCASHVKLESANRTDDNFNENLGESVHEKIVYKNNEEIELEAGKKQCVVYDNDNRRRHGLIDQSGLNANVFTSEDVLTVKVDSLSSHCDIPYTNEEVTECSTLEVQNSTNIVCCPDILGEIAQSHSKRRRKKIKQADEGRKPGEIEQIHPSEHGRVVFIDVNAEVRRPPTPYRCEDLNRCALPLPITSSQECRIDPVEEFILPDILPVTSQARLEDEILAASGTQCVTFSLKNIKKEFPKATHFKEDGAPTGNDYFLSLLFSSLYSQATKQKINVCRNNTLIIIIMLLKEVLIEHLSNFYRLFYILSFFSFVC